MKNFQSRVRQARLERGLSQGELAKLAGFKNQSSIGTIESTKSKRTGTTLISSLAKALNVNPHWLETGLGPKELSNITVVSNKNGMIPILSWDQALFFKNFVNNFNGVKEGFEMVNITSTVNPHTFALKVLGDAMAPDFMEGEIIVVEPDLSPIDGDYVIAQIEDVLTFKKLVSDMGKQYLIPVNKQYDKVEVTEDVKIIGVVRECTRTFR